MYRYYLKEVCDEASITGINDIIGMIIGKVSLQACNKYIGSMFLHTIDNKHYRDLKVDLANKHMLGDDKFPRHLTRLCRYSTSALQ